MYLSLYSYHYKIHRVLGDDDNEPGSICRDSDISKQSNKMGGEPISPADRLFINNHDGSLVLVRDLC